MGRVKADRLVYIREQQSNIMHKSLQEKECIAGGRNRCFSFIRSSELILMERKKHTWLADQEKTFTLITNTITCIHGQPLAGFKPKSKKDLT